MGVLLVLLKSPRRPETVFQMPSPKPAGGWCYLLLESLRRALPVLHAPCWCLSVNPLNTLGGGRSCYDGHYMGEQIQSQRHEHVQGYVATVVSGTAGT